MDSLRPLTVSLSPRPLRSALFVATPEGVPWQAAFRVALRSQTGTWGGAGNVVLPLRDGDVGDDELLWALLDAFDPDLIQAMPVHVGDVEDLAPSYFAERAAHRACELGIQPPASLPEAALVDLRRERLTSPLLDESLQTLLVDRLAPLSGPGALTGFMQTVFDPPASPLVAVEKLRPLPEDVVVDVGWPDDDLAAMGAGLHGELSPRLVGALRRVEVGIIESEISEPGLAWEAALTPRANSPLRRLAKAGLGMYFQPGAPMPGLVICIGDEPWDFALAMALQRLGVTACWVPSRAANDVLALSTLAGQARRARQYSPPGGRPRLCSVSSADAVNALAAVLGGMLTDISVETCTPLELVPSAPGRLYEYERVGFYQTTVVHQGVTPLLPTPVPEGANRPGARHPLDDRHRRGGLAKHPASDARRPSPEAAGDPGGGPVCARGHLLPLSGAPDSLRHRA